MKIYVASSWRNEHQPRVVELLRANGHEVYDFRNPSKGGPKTVYGDLLDGGFRWSYIDPEWESWTVEQYRSALESDVFARAGFTQDYGAMEWADTVLLVQPCGRSAHLELGWAVGAGKYTSIYFPDGVCVEPELMAKMADETVIGEGELGAWSDDGLARC